MAIAEKAGINLKHAFAENRHTPTCCLCERFGGQLISASRFLVLGLCLVPCSQNLRVHNHIHVKSSDIVGDTTVSSLANGSSTQFLYLQSIARPGVGDTAGESLTCVCVHSRCFLSTHLGHPASTSNPPLHVSSHEVPTLHLCSRGCGARILQSVCVSLCVCVYAVLV